MSFLVPQNMNILEVAQFRPLSNRLEPFPHAVTHFRDELITFRYDWYPHGDRIFDFFKLKHNPNSTQLILDRKIVVNKERIASSPKARLFAFDSTDLKKPIVILVNNSSGLCTFEIYDYETMKLLATSNQHLYLNTYLEIEVNFLFVLWKHQYLVDEHLRTMQLKPQDPGADDNLPYTIEWTNGLNYLPFETHKIFNISNSM